MNKVLTALLSISLLGSATYAANPSSSSSNYPSSYDTDEGAHGAWPLITNVDPATPTWANRVRNAIDAVQRELGINPSGNLATLGERLNVEHDQDGKHSGFSAETFTFGKDTWSGYYWESGESEIVYSTVRLNFGNQKYSDWEVGEQDFPVYMQWEPSSGIFKFSHTIQAPFFQGNGSALTGVVTTGFSTVTGQVNIGTSEFSPSNVSGTLVINTNDNSTTTADSPWRIYSNRFGLHIDALNVNAQNQILYLTSNNQDLFMECIPQGANKNMQLRLQSTGQGAGSLVIPSSNSTSGSSQNISFSDRLMSIGARNGENFAYHMYFGNAGNTSNNSTFRFYANGVSQVHTSFDGSINIGSETPIVGGDGIYIAGLQVINSSGQFLGTVTGNVTGNVSGNVTGTVTGTVTGQINGKIRVLSSDPVSPTPEAGHFYFNTNSNLIRVYNGSSWVNAGMYL